MMAPPRQTATETISTLSSRLTSATLLEDRRAAILGLRSFAKQYPASVASGALRDLIACLTRDLEDVDTLKVVLETLLGLFHPDENSPEASEEITLWLADQFSQRQDNITILINLLDPDKPDFYSRLYALQLIRAVALARPERTQECILAAPMGTAWLVSSLDDARDAVRNEGLVLLIALSRSSTELQKLFVFEDAFTKIFDMVQADGGLQQGGVVVQDCLSLLASLVRYNTSNQTNIREMGHVARFGALLPGNKKVKKGRADAKDDEWTSPQNDKNVWGLLAIMRMFLVKGSAGTIQNQTVFHQHGLLRQLLNITFDPSTAMPIKIEALNTCADMIRGNAPLQEDFAREQVQPMVNLTLNGANEMNKASEVYVIEALLNLVLNPASSDRFDIRNAGCECIKAYCFNHSRIQEHFLGRAIHGHEHGDETANALTILMEGSSASPAYDPYRLWFAAVLIFHLIFNVNEAKAALMQVKEGDADSGEEVVTCIQTLTANLISSLQLGEDDRVPIAYLMILLGWLFEDASAVDDFLGEASSLQSLVQVILTPGHDRVIVQGLCAALLGVVFEFSTKDSPVPRRDLQSVLTSKLGRERYLSAVFELRHHPFVRDFEVLPRTGGVGGIFPDVYFDETFIDFLKDNFSRLSRAIDRNPNIEQHQSKNEGVDRDVVDALRGERDEQMNTIQDLKAQLMTLEQRVDHEQAEHRKTQQSADEQRSTLKRINDKLHEDLDKEAARKDREHKQAMLEVENSYNLRIVALNKDAAKMRQNYEQKQLEANKAYTTLDHQHATLERAHRNLLDEAHAMKNTHRSLEAEVTQLTEKLRTQEAQFMRQILAQQVQSEEKLHIQEAHIKDLESQIKKFTEEKEILQSILDNMKTENQELKTRVQDQTWKVKDAEEKARKAQVNTDKELKDLQNKLRGAEQGQREKQTELDDLFVMLGDLEEKHSNDKKRLKELGEEVSEAEDEDEDEDEE